jgi:hypothetical protein
MTMKTIRISLSLLAASLVLSGCGDDGKSPAIRSFVASSTSLPEGGADVTFTWSVKREKTLELLPFPGVVTGTSATVTVTEPTIFTLVATNGDGTARKKVSIATGEPITVTGQVLSYYGGRPVQGVQVFVDDQFYVTDANGAFTAEGVVPPYDVGVLVTDGGVLFGAPSGTLRGSVYRGVTRPDPKILYPGSSSYTRAGQVSGTVTGGAGFPYPTPTPDPGYETSIYLSGPYASLSGFGASSADGSFLSDVYWNGGGTETVALNVIQYSNVPEISYTGYGRATGIVPDQGVADIDIAMSPIGTGHIVGTVTAPFEITGFDFIGGWADVGAPGLAPPGSIFGGPPMEYAERLYLPATVGTANDFDFPYPEIAGASFGLSVFGYGPNGSVYAIRSGLVAGETGVEVEFPAIPVLLTPVPFASAGPTTIFSVSPVEGAVYKYRFRSDGSGGPIPTFGGSASPTIDIDVYSSSNATSLPDPDLFAGVDFESREFSWSVDAVVGYGNVDGIVENAQVVPAGEYAMSSEDDERYFTYGTPLAPF